MEEFCSILKKLKNTQCQNLKNYKNLDSRKILEKTGIIKK